MHTTHDVTDDRREADRMREELDLIEAQLIARPESSAADYMERRRLLSIGPDRAAYLQFERETEVGDMVRESLQQQRADLITTLAELEGKATRHPTPGPDNRTVDNINGRPAAPVHVPAPGPAPAFVDPSVLRAYEKAKAAAVRSSLPVAAPVVPPQQATTDENGEALMLGAVARRHNEQRRHNLETIRALRTPGSVLTEGERLMIAAAENASKRRRDYGR
jgi:hypothetical protein